ncbi:hypothetical protein GGX14DRAFT_343586 [Mycena pura]|uniref:Reverse transcriptase zinc-binding domain-containing protein n=1 Tax=Mycena pura TaxID=153505 RepID=A0AAD6YUC6_9AGAR|nr:hypothetical protein GGX14DRAFT_343586 [Mycena pura]
MHRNPLLAGKPAQSVITKIGFFRHSPTDGVRVLTKIVCKPPARPEPRRRRGQIDEALQAAVTVYIGSRKDSPKRKLPTVTGAAWFSNGDPRNISFRLPQDWNQEIRNAEFVAALQALCGTRADTDITIVSRGGSLRDAMNIRLGTWEAQGWVGVQDRALLKCLAAELRTRTGNCIFKVAEAPSVEYDNCMKAANCAKEALSVMRNEQPNSLETPGEYTMNGVCLANTNQKIFYQAIREWKESTREPRTKTDLRITEVQNGVLQSFDRMVLPAQIWCTVYNLDFSRPVREFLWKSLHDAHRIGSYWKHIPECKDRVLCATCGVTKNLAHVLVECTVPGQQEIWAAAEELWKKKAGHWPELPLGSLLGCGLARFPKEAVPARCERLYHILISESMFVIWKLRNERVIDPNVATHSAAEILNKWNTAITNCFEVDRVLANRPKKGRLASLNPTHITDTWSSVLANEGNLGADWLKHAGVLVGSTEIASRTVATRRRDG